MEVLDFFLKFEITEQSENESFCVGCECSVAECGKFPGCPLPWGYVFKKSRGKLPKYLSKEKGVSHRRPTMHLLCIGVLFHHFNISLSYGLQSFIKHY